MIRSTKEILEIVKRYREKIPVDVESLASALGIVVEKHDLSDKVSGLIQKIDPERYKIVVNCQHPETRQRFTIAHELGHFVWHRLLFGDENVDDVAYRAVGFKNNKIGKSEETEANRFAANLLMPAEAIISLQDRGINDAHRMAQALKVSESAMSIRLEDFLVRTSLS